MSGAHIVENTNNEKIEKPKYFKSHCFHPHTPQ